MELGNPVGSKRRVIAAYLQAVATALAGPDAGFVDASWVKQGPEHRNDDWR